MKKCRISKRLKFTKIFRSSISLFEYCVSSMFWDWEWTLLTWIWLFNEKSRLVFEHSCNESIERRKIQIELKNLYDFTRSDAKKKDRLALISLLNQVNFEMSWTRVSWRTDSAWKRRWTMRKEELKSKKEQKVEKQRARNELRWRKSTIWEIYHLFMQLVNEFDEIVFLIDRRMSNIREDTMKMLHSYELSSDCTREFSAIFE